MAEVNLQDISKKLADGSITDQSQLDTAVQNQAAPKLDIGASGGLYTGNNLTSASLTPAPTANFTKPAETPVYPIQTLDNGTNLTETPSEKKANSLTDEIQALNSQLTGEAAYRAEQEKTQDIAGKTQTLNDLSSQLKALQNEAQAIPLQMQQDATGRGITAGGLAPLQTARIRTNSIQALGISSLLEASRGNLATAQTLVDKAVAQRFDPIKSEIQAKKDNLDLILKSPAYSLEDKNRAAAQLAKQTAQEKLVAKQEQDAKDIMATATTAAKNGADALTLKKIQEAKTPAEALQIAAAANAISTNQNITELIKKYPDAGILPTDTFEVAQTKLKSSPTYQKSIASGNSQANSLINKGYTYVATPAERDAFKAQGRTVQEIDGKTYVAPTKTIKGLRGSYTIVDSITNKPIGGRGGTAPVITSSNGNAVINRTPIVNKETGNVIQPEAPDYLLQVIKNSKGGKAVDVETAKSLEKAFNVVGQISDLQAAIGDEETGPILGIIRSADPYDTKAQAIKAQLTAIVPNLARGIYGEVGVLTDNDVALYSRTLPNLKSTEEVRQLILGATIRSVQRSIENKFEVMAGLGRDVSGLENKYKKVKLEADKLIATTKAEKPKNVPPKNAPVSDKVSSFVSNISQENKSEEQKPGVGEKISNFIRGLFSY